MVLIQILSTVICILLSVAFFSIFERKVMGLSQYRQGPQKIGYEGLGQPFSDAMKLLWKDEILPWKAESSVFFMSPLFMFILSLLVWVFKPLSSKAEFYPLEGGFLLFMMSVTVYGLVFTGWFSSSSYGLLGCVRGFSQSISYEVGLVIGLVTLFLFSSSLSMGKFLSFPLFVPLSILFAMFILVFVAELNRVPFDLSEGESELVSGFNVEYGGLSYTLTFLSENGFLVWTSYLLSLLFFQSSVLTFLSLMFLLVWVRVSFVRIRFDKVMALFWESVLPVLISLSLLFIIYL